jgi:hypothetical protein
MSMIFLFVAFVACLFGTFFLINLLGLNAAIPVVLLWVGAELLRESIVPLEVKDSRLI